MNAYTWLKLLHVTTVLVSVSLFVLRFALLARFPDRPLAKPLKVLPHINDTILLAAAIGMLVVLQLNAFTTPWLLAKIVALLFYIALGALCLRAKPGSTRQVMFFLLAIAAFGYIVLVALGKQAMPAIFI